MAAGFLHSARSTPHRRPKPTPLGTPDPIAGCIDAGRITLPSTGISLTAEKNPTRTLAFFDALNEETKPQRRTG
jgi:hypothetical protein